jgi:hypothetical protein
VTTSPPAPIIDVHAHVTPQRFQRAVLSGQMWHGMGPSAGELDNLKNRWMPRLDEVARCDLAIVGIPFDSGTTYRPGARFGPAAIRQGSKLLRPYNPAQDTTPFNTVQVGRQPVAGRDAEPEQGLHRKVDNCQAEGLTGAPAKAHHVARACLVKLAHLAVADQLVQQVQQRCCVAFDQFGTLAVRRLSRATVRLVVGEAMEGRGTLLQRIHRRPDRRLDRLALVGQEGVDAIRVSDSALESGRTTSIHFPQ